MIGTKLISCESFNYAKSYYDPILNDPAALANVAALGTHLYGTSVSAYAYPLADQKGGGKERWMTEHYTDSTTDANAWPNALGVATELHHAMVEGQFSLYTWWYIVRSYGPIGASGAVTKRGWCMAQFSKFIRPGFYRVDATASPSAGVYLSAYKSGTDVVVVVVNTNTSASALTVAINGTTISAYDRFTTSSSKNLASEGKVTATNGSVMLMLDGQSVTTLHGTGTVSGGGGSSGTGGGSGPAGSTGTGGAAGAGGRSSTGGVSGTGGLRATGGAPGSGGVVGTGGSSTGGSGTGGTSALHGRFSGVRRLSRVRRQLAAARDRLRRRLQLPGRGSRRTLDADRAADRGRSVRAGRPAPPADQLPLVALNRRDHGRGSAGCFGRGGRKRPGRCFGRPSSPCEERDTARRCLLCGRSPRARRGRARGRGVAQRRPSVALLAVFGEDASDREELPCDRQARTMGPSVYGNAGASLTVT